MANQVINIVSKHLTSHISLKSKRFHFILFFALTGFLISVYQILGNSPDYKNYEIFFDLLRQDGFDIIGDYRFEPGFTFFSLILTTLFTSNALVYGWIVAAVLLLKGWAINAYSSTMLVFTVVVIFYFARYYPLHELTQLRAAGAIGFLMIAAIFLWRGNLLHGLLACALAAMFHMSAVAMIPALFIYPTKRWQTISIGVFAFILVFLLGDLVTYLLGYRLAVFAGYQAHGFGDNAPNPLSATLLLDWAIIIIALIMWSKLSLLMKRIVFLQIFGMAIFYGATDFPVVSHRIREFYSVFWVFFVADGLRLKAMRIPTAGFVMVSIGLYSNLFIFSGAFFH